MSETLNFTNTPDCKPIYTKNIQSNVNEQPNQNNTQNYSSPTFILLKKPSDPKILSSYSNTLNNINTNTTNTTTVNTQTPQISVDEINRDIEENSSTPPPPEGNEIDDFIIKLLQGNDRLNVLKLDTELEKFMRDPNVTRLEFPPTSSYQRLIVHRVAQYYKLEHPSIDLGGQKRAIILTKTKESRTPALRLCDLVEQEEPAPSKSVKILSRKNSSNNSPSENPIILQKNPGSQTLQQKNPKSQESFESLSSEEQENRLNNKSLEEREAEYLRARARIFKDDPNNTSNNGINNNQPSTPISPITPHPSNPPTVTPNPNVNNNPHFNTYNNMNVNHSPPPQPLNTHNIHPHDHYNIEKEKEMIKKEVKSNTRQKPNNNYEHKAPMNDYPPNPDPITWAPVNNSTWTHPSDFSSVDPRSWDKFPKYNPVPISEPPPYLVPHSDHPIEHLHHQFPQREHISNPNLNINNNLYNFTHHPKRYENPTTPNNANNYPVHGDQYVYYETPINLWPNYSYNYFPANHEPIYGPPHFYTRVQSVPQLRRDYERPPPKSTHLFDPNAPQPHYPRSDNFNSSNVKSDRYPAPPKNYYSQPKMKPNIDTLAPTIEKPVCTHILEITGVSGNSVSCDDEVFQEIYSAGANVKLLEDKITLVAVFKNSTTAKFALDNLRSNHFTLQPWSKN